MADYFSEKSKFYYEKFLQKKYVRKVTAIIKHLDKFLVIVTENKKAHTIGGSVDDGESTVAAVRREILEEVEQIPLNVKYLCKRYYKIDWQYGDIKFPNKRIEFYYLCDLQPNNLKLVGLEGEFSKNMELKWCSIQELEKLKLSEKELELIKNIKK